MSRSRRTEHCWPVAYTLDDLLPLIPDPASFEVGSVLRIERLMLEPVRNQFIVELADRYVAASWEVIYIAADNWRGEKVADTGIKATMISCGPNWKEQIRTIAEDYPKSIVVTEVLNCVGLDHDRIVAVPRAVTTLEPVACPHCGKPTFASWFKPAGLLISSCRPKSHQRWEASLHTQIKTTGQKRGVYSRSQVSPSRQQYPPWTAEQELAARQLRAEGLTWKQIAARIGRSQHGIRIYLSKGGMEGTRLRQQRRANRRRRRAAAADC